MTNNLIKIVRDINLICRNSISGSNCTDKNLCFGECCREMIDIPITLAEEYIRLGYADQSFFIRDLPLGFKIKTRMHIDAGNIIIRCYFFDLTNNNCMLHDSCLKPPQCCLYPINFEKNYHRCKNGNLWNLNEKNFAQINELKQIYHQRSKEEYNEDNSEEKIWVRMEKNLNKSLSNIKPSEFIGVFDDIGEIRPLIIEKVIRYEVMDFCDKINCETNYEECDSLCVDCTELIKILIKKSINKIAQSNGSRNEYYFQHLRNFISLN